MESVSHIITARHYAARVGVGTVLERIQKIARNISGRGGVAIIIPGTDSKGFAVQAEIEFGQWVARCECGGVEMVDPDEPIFFCFSCGNRANQRALRPVHFPQRRAEIEQLVLERPVDDARGLDDLDRAFQAKAILFSESGLPLTRSWVPGETLAELRKQNKPVYERLKSQAAEAGK
jgi:hypothetical protein